MTDKLAYKLVACIPGKVRPTIKILGYRKGMEILHRQELEPSKSLERSVYLGIKII